MPHVRQNLLEHQIVLLCLSIQGRVLLWKCLSKYLITRFLYHYPEPKERQLQDEEDFFPWKNLCLQKADD